MTTARDKKTPQDQHHCYRRIAYDEPVDNPVTRLLLAPRCDNDIATTGWGRAAVTAEGLRMFVTPERRRSLSSRFLSAGLVPVLTLVAATYEPALAPVAAAFDPTTAPVAAASSCDDGWQAMPGANAVAAAPG